MNEKEESLDEKIARIRRQNEKIEQRKKLIEEEIEDAKRNNAIVQLKSKIIEGEKNDDFGRTLYSDKLSPERKPVKFFEEDVGNARTRMRKSALQTNNTDEEWREERKRIDEERIQRQKANSGFWKREWDADKFASSQEHDNRTSKDPGNRFSRTTSVIERAENRGTYNYNEPRGNYNKYNMNEDDNTQNRWKTDTSFRKTYSERRSTHNYDNRTPNRNDARRTSISETDQYNNNATKSFLKNNFRSGIQNMPFSTKNNESEEKSLDAAKLYLKTNFQNDTQITKNYHFQKKNWGIEPSHVIPSVEFKSNDFHLAGDAKPRVESQKKEQLTSVQNKTGPFAFLSNKSSNANIRSISKFENKFKNTEENGIKTKDHESSSIISKDLKNIVIQVGNSGISCDKREVKRFNELRSDFNVPNFSSNLNTSREIDTEISSSYGSMTFERSNLKQKISPTYSDTFSSSPAIVTQLFSNSKLSDVDANLKPMNLTRTIKNDVQNFPTNFQSPDVFQFTAISNKPDFGDIVHNVATSQDVKITRTIRNENIKIVKESPKNNPNYESEKPKNIKTSKNIQNKTDEVKYTKVVKNEELEEPEFDDEWDDCSDDEVEEFM